MSDWLYGVEVPPLSIANIRKVTSTIRSASEFDNINEYPIMELLEHWMHMVFDKYDWEPREHLPNNQEACCYPDGCPDNPDGPLILIREDVYEAACDRDGRARFTIAHEIGHVFLHKNVPPVHNRKRKGADLKPFENSEWQANTFSGELLMPPASFDKTRSFNEFCKRMGVSEKAALTQARKLIKRKEITKPIWFDVELQARGMNMNI